MARFIPENAESREFPAAAVVAYCYESKRGPALLAYKGRPVTGSAMAIPPPVIHVGQPADHWRVPVHIPTGLLRE